MCRPFNQPVPSSGLPAMIPDASASTLIYYSMKEKQNSNMALPSRQWSPPTAVLEILDAPRL